MARRRGRAVKVAAGGDGCPGRLGRPYRPSFGARMIVSRDDEYETRQAFVRVDPETHEDAQPTPVPAALLTRREAIEFDDRMARGPGIVSASGVGRSEP